MGNSCGSANYRPTILSGKIKIFFVIIAFILWNDRPHHSLTANIFLIFIIIGLDKIEAILCHLKQLFFLLISQIFNWRRICNNTATLILIRSICLSVCFIVWLNLLCSFISCLFMLILWSDGLVARVNWFGFLALVLDVRTIILRFFKQILRKKKLLILKK